MSLFPVRALACVAALAVLGTTACVPVRLHEGYIVDKELTDSIQPGVDTRESVMATLGQPSFTSQFNKDEWYYISRNSSNFAYNKPHIKQQMTLRIRFDPKGNVSSVEHTGPELIAAITPDSKKTPTLGKHRGLLEDLFGNIGTVGVPGAGAPGGAGGP